jgi:hypothetical protein
MELLREALDGIHAALPAGASNGDILVTLHPAGFMLSPQSVESLLALLCRSRYIPL